jgi:hypothetical protein
MREKKLHFIFYFFGVYVISVFLLLGLTVSIEIRRSFFTLVSMVTYISVHYVNICFVDDQNKRQLTYIHHYISMESLGSELIGKLV